MKICVFCSSSNAVDNIYFDGARQLGELIAQNKYQLVYGGANVGLMNEVAKSVSFNGAKITGVIPRKIHDFKLSTNLANDLIITETMNERKNTMHKLSDAFIALPGGFGTLEEILEVITLKQLDYHQKPIVFINTKGFYNNLFKQFEYSFEEAFAKENYRELYMVVDNPLEAINYIQNYKHTELGTKWFKVPHK